MDDMGDYLQKRAGQLNLGRAGQLAGIQAWLDHEYPGQARAVSMNDGVLKIITYNSPLASELSMRRVEITALNTTVKRINIQSGTRN